MYRKTTDILFKYYYIFAVSTVALSCNNDLSGTYTPFHHHGEVIGWEKRPSVIVKPDEVCYIKFFI